MQACTCQIGINKNDLFTYLRQKNRQIDGCHTRPTSTLSGADSDDPTRLGPGTIFHISIHESVSQALWSLFP
jgi:hypothetical protein